MQQRYYDPVIGRFLSVDPVTADPTTGINFNRYWYANNNPYMYTDPDGRFSTCTAYSEGGNSGPCMEIAGVTGEVFNTLGKASEAAASGLMRLQERFGFEYGIAYSQGDDGRVTPTVAVAGSTANPDGDPYAVNLGPLLAGTKNPIGDAHKHPDNVSFARRVGNMEFGADLRVHERRVSQYARVPDSTHTSYVYRRTGSGRGAADMVIGRFVPNPDKRPGSATHVIQRKELHDVFQIRF